MDLRTGSRPVTFPSAANPGAPLLVPRPTIGVTPLAPAMAVPAYPAAPMNSGPAAGAPAWVVPPARQAVPTTVVRRPVPANPYGFRTTANPAALVPAPIRLAPAPVPTAWPVPSGTPAPDPWGMPWGSGFSFANGGGTPLGAGGYASGQGAFAAVRSPRAAMGGSGFVGGQPALAYPYTAPQGGMPGTGDGFVLDAGLPMPLPAGPPMLFDRSGWNAAAVGHFDVEAALALAYQVAASLPADAVAERMQLEALIGRLEANPDAATIDLLADYAETLAAGIGGLRPVAETLRIALDDASNGAYYDASVAQPAMPWDGEADPMATYRHLYDATGAALPAGVPMEGLDDVAATIEEFIPFVAGTDLEGILDQIAADIEYGHLDAATAANHLRTLLPQIDPASTAWRIANTIAGMLVQSIDRASDGAFTDALFGDPNAALDLPDLRGLGATGDFATGQWLGEPRVPVPFSRQRQPGSGTPTVSYIRRPEGSAGDDGGQDPFALDRGGPDYGTGLPQGVSAWTPFHGPADLRRDAQPPMNNRLWWDINYRRLGLPQYPSSIEEIDGARREYDPRGFEEWEATPWGMSLRNGAHAETAPGAIPDFYIADPNFQPGVSPVRFGRAVLDGIGIGDEVAGFLGGVGNLFGEGGYRAGYRRGATDYNQATTNFAATNPAASLVANGIGIAPTLLVPGAAAIRAATLPGQIARGVAAATAEGAAFGFAQGNGVGDRLSNAAIGAGLSLPFGLAAPIVGPIVQRGINSFLRRPSVEVVAPRPVTGAEVLSLPIDDPMFYRTRDNQRFVRGPDGTENFTILPPVAVPGTSVGPLPVRLSRRNLVHIDDLTHSDHATTFGYRDGLHLTDDVATNWTELRLARDVNGEQRLVLIRDFGDNQPGVFVALKAMADGQYWRVITSGFRTGAEFDTYPLLATRPLAGE